MISVMLFLLAALSFFLDLANKNLFDKSLGMVILGLLFLSSGLAWWAYTGTPRYSSNRIRG